MIPSLHLSELDVTNTDDYVYEVLTCNPASDYAGTLDIGTFSFRYDVAAALASSFMLAFVAILIYSDPKLHKHPNTLIAMIFLCDSYMFFEFASRYILCGFEL